MRSAMRAEVMQLIEHFIERSSPEIVDCLDSILPSMMAALEARYGKEVMTDVLHEYGHLRLALLEMEDTLPTEYEPQALQEH